MTYQPYEILGQDRGGRFICVCDHATNIVPDFVAGGDLGLPAHDMERHIAFDIGAAGVTAALAERLDSPAILSNFSRLVVDPNRGEDDPTLIMRLYDGSVIPANRNIDAAERENRLDRLHRRYHAALGELIEAKTNPVLVAVHSFSPQLKGRSKRPWHVGLVYDDDTRIVDPLITRLKLEGDLCVGDNEPYRGSLSGDSMDRHALQNGHAHVLLELRNDLISDESDQQLWADRLARILTEALADSGY